jgi:hypothetical protein
MRCHAISRAANPDVSADAGTVDTAGAADGAEREPDFGVKREGIEN